jgi:hypothetical protein
VFAFSLGAAFFFVVLGEEEEVDEAEAGRMTADVEGVGFIIAVVELAVIRGLGVV